ncbi:MAG: aminoacyl-tRNA hydrolase [Patescibacteria group bacterium]|nr:aminoacyl-tRNA hydrolase [Patescibacteria group bacterium]
MNFKVVLGLGNPDKKYKNTYHNVGHAMIDFLLNNDIFPQNTLLAKNEGFMNESGNSAHLLTKKTGATPEELLVIHDDSDIALGEFKLSQNRGAGGHKGVEDIINRIGSKNFWRLRIGIRPMGENLKAEDFVLNKIKKEQLLILEKVFEKAASTLLKTILS